MHAGLISPSLMGWSDMQNDLFLPVITKDDIKSWPVMQSSDPEASGFYYRSVSHELRLATVGWAYQETAIREAAKTSPRDGYRVDAEAVKRMRDRYVRIFERD